MKKNVIICGLISGILVSGMMMGSVIAMVNDPNFQGNMVLGYASMILAFSLIFVGIKNYRDKYNNGQVTFGKGFLIGLYITLIASTIYVITWLFEYYLFFPDFMDRYSEHVMLSAEKSGASAAELKSQQEEMNTYKELYKNPLFVILMTYAEILPVGLLISLIAAAILRKKPGAESAVINN